MWELAMTSPSNFLHVLFITFSQAFAGWKIAGDDVIESDLQLHNTNECKLSTTFYSVYSLALHQNELFNEINNHLKDFFFRFS